MMPMPVTDHFFSRVRGEPGLLLCTTCGCAIRVKPEDIDTLVGHINKVTLHDVLFLRGPAKCSGPVARA